MSSPTFDFVIITAPSKFQSQVYFSLCNSIKKQLVYFQNTQFLCVHDPVDCRVGSGGGTLNAIDSLIKEYDCDHILLSRLLIIHSGGDSRRSPLHSVCGKAWATLGSYSFGNLLSTPLVLLLIEFHQFCVNLPPGSIVVASSDVLLDIVKVHGIISISRNSLFTLCRMVDLNLLKML
jgi:fucokinase